MANPSMRFHGWPLSHMLFAGVSGFTGLRLRGRWPHPSPRQKSTVRPFLTHAAAIRLAIFAMVARLQPVAFSIEVQECLDFSICAMPALRFSSSGLPL